MQRLLMADKDKSYAEVLETALMGEGFHLTKVYDLEEWCSILKSRRFDLIIMDESFMTISRELFSITKKAYKKLNKTPIIVMTIYPEWIEFKHKFPAQARFLLKPFQASEMIHLLHQVLFEEAGVFA